MFWRALLLVCTVRCIEQTDVILSPDFNNVLENSTFGLTCNDPENSIITIWGIEQTEVFLSPTFNDVLENSSLELTCNDSENSNFTIWGTLNEATVFSYLSFSKEGACTTDGFLADRKHYETRCYSNSTFKVKIKRVNISNHGQEWFCSRQFIKSNTAFIFVQVPIKYVRITNLSSESLMTVEKTKTTLFCETSEGRPVPNIKWTKVSKKGIRIDLTNDLAYKVSREEILTERNMTILRSSINIEPRREDNGSRIICEATNMKLNVARKEITLYVQYPPNRPTFVSDVRIRNGSIRIISGQNVSVLCRSDSYPHPTYLWNTTGRSEYGQYLNISTHVKSNTWQCTSTNNMTLPNSTMISGTNSTMIKIHLLYEIEMFYVIGHENSEVFEVTENDTIVFKCRHLESELVLLFEEKELWHNPSNETLIYALEVTSCFDDGVYKCVAQNKYNSKLSLKEVRLIVRCTPLISPEFDLKTNVSSAQNESITLQFKAIAYPTPNFYWFKLRGSSWNSLKSDNKYEINTTENYSNLSIIGITEKDYGVYKLRIQNDVGSIEQLYYLKTNDFPSLTKKPIHNWMYTIYACGGVMITLAVIVVAWFFKKRWLKQHSSNRALYQNVPFRVPETNNIHHTSTHITVHKDRNMFPIRNAAANESQKMTKRPQENKIYENEQELNLELEAPFSVASEYFNTLELMNMIEKIKVTELYHYVKGRTDESFGVDFQKIPTGLQMPCSFARTQENIAFNRYRDILPYDHTRVCIDDQPDFFINASYIDGYMKPKMYIACLGPTASTHDNFKTFWKMVWHEKTELIVMVTNLNEPSGMKCEQYWSDASQDEMYGDILVSCQKIEMFAEYTIRSFEVTKTTNAERSCRRLVHLHYTAWPDKKTPEDVTSILEFRQKFEHIRKTVNSPVIVHCSAGIGRTGVFIAIDRLIMQGKTEGSVNVVACITEMRRQRVNMVQNSEQYKFIFQALAYALNFDCGPIPIESLTDHNEISDESFFVKEYKELQLCLEWESKGQIDSIAKTEIHKDKNRRGSDISENKNRVYLYLNRSYDDLDYINAVFINSFKCKDYFIMAQSPLPGTESDFLTMIYQENCFCVVSMEDFNDHGMKIGKYLLEEKQSLDIGSFKVSCFIDDSKPQYTVWKVTIKNNFQLSKSERDFYQFQYNNWTAENNKPQNAEEFVELVKDVQEYAIFGEENSHVLVHCSKANERSGLFCAIAIIREKLLFDEQVSIMNTLRHLRTRRPSAITSMEQLKFCYKAAVIIAQRQNEGIYVNNSIII